MSELSCAAAANSASHDQLLALSFHGQERLLALVAELVPPEIDLLQRRLALRERSGQGLCATRADAAAVEVDPLQGAGLRQDARQGIRALVTDAVPLENDRLQRIAFREGCGEELGTSRADAAIEKRDILEGGGVRQGDR